MYFLLKFKERKPKSMCRSIHHPNQQSKKTESQRNPVSVREVRED